MTTIFTVMYFGNAKKYQDLCEEIAAYSKREAVERIYSKILDENYFPQDGHGRYNLIEDCDGNVIANENSETIEHDGGYFYAEPVIL